MTAKEHRIRKTAPALGAAFALVALALGAAACGGGPSPGAGAHVASLSQTTSRSAAGSSGVTSTTAPESANPSQLMDQWATCMRSNGDPSQTDPTIDVNGVINITMQNVTQAVADEAHGSTGPCARYEVAAQNALREGRSYQPPDQTQQVQYAQCMRANGEPNYPDPGTGEKTDLEAVGIDPNSAFFQKANRICGKQINAPAWWIDGTGPPGDVVVTSCQGAPQCPPPGAGGTQRGAVTPAPGNGGSGANGDG